jgi:NitT/TauT family transport system substrate-binding protein
MAWRPQSDASDDQSHAEVGESQNEGGWPMRLTQSRRHFLTTLGLGASGLLRTPPSLAAEGPPEMTTLRLATLSPGICIAPQYVADALLRAEGFTDIQYVISTSGAPIAAAVADGKVDFSLNYAGPNIIAIEAGEPILTLAGVHVGCFELFAHEGIRSIADLKGKSVAVQAIGSSQHVYLATMLAYIGLDPGNDVVWVTSASPTPSELFAAGKVDAFLGFAPEPQDLRARHIGQVVVNSAVDRPWSQYFCCMLIGNREFVSKHPAATKRAIRAILKAADLCATQPEPAARRIVDGGFTPRYDYAVETLNELPYDKWREYEPEDTMRFYALRLREAGLIRSTPQKIIAEGTDWRFLNELKRELKA